MRHLVRTTVAAVLGLMLVSPTARAADATPTNETILSFAGEDGQFPQGVIADAVGVLFGVTEQGGTSTNCDQITPGYKGCGTIFRLLPPTAPGARWTHEVLYDFKGLSDGASPTAAPIVDSMGNIFGTTLTGGSKPFTHEPPGGGVVWRLSPPASTGVWKYTVLHTFIPGKTDGFFPFAGLALGEGGRLYGVTRAGGSHDLGTIFALSPPLLEGGAWVETILHSFDLSEGVNPEVTPVLTGHDTELLGFDSPAARGLCPGCPALYDLQLSPSLTRFGIRARIEGENEGEIVGPPLIRNNHKVYYAPELTGPEAVGTIEELSPPEIAGGAWTITVVHVFRHQGQEGFLPSGGLIANAAGSLFGLTGFGGTHHSQGTAYRLDPPTSSSMTWTYNVLHDFTGSMGNSTTRPDGARPTGQLVFGYRHQLYGTTQVGGRYDRGTVFRQSPY